MFRALMLAAAAVSLVVFFAACGDDGGSDEPQQITFMAGFRAQANLPFVAVYVADAKGFFADEGLSVDVQHSSGQDEHLKLLLEDQVQFITGTASQVIRRRVGELPVQAVALFGQRGDQGFIARADSGIASPADFAGRTVGFKAGVVPAELHALLATAGLTVDDVELQSVGFDPRTFIEGEVEVYPVFLNNEPDTVQRAGVDIVVFDPHDLGVPTLGLTYLANEETVSSDPELVERFLRATLRAIEYIEGNIDEAVEITLTYAEGADPEHQRFLLETDLAAAQRADGIGRGDAAQWQALVDLLLEYDVIEQGTDIESAFVGSFVDDLYDDDGNLR
ncbi:MAG: ABC transporter substrate-binding protein [Dehalococcoidia bacterium]|jgi:ABC-type nitrate/sulfonate/bicarbonate transport system substrate-binding protein|nr:ABC transporter substrate-binding protein [Dehalococcoidia bacterium]